MLKATKHPKVSVAFPNGSGLGVRPPRQVLFVIDEENKSVSSSTGFRQKVLQPPCPGFPRDLYSTTVATGMATTILHSRGNCSVG